MATIVRGFVDPIARDLPMEYALELNRPAEALSRTFAMKALAARTRDVDDLLLLSDIIGVKSADEAPRICATRPHHRSRDHGHDLQPTNIQASEAPARVTAGCSMSDRHKNYRIYMT